MTPACPRVLVIAPQPFYEDRGTPIAVKHLLEALVELNFEVDLATFPVGSPFELSGVSTYRANNPFRIQQVPIGLSLSKVLLDLSMIRLIRERLMNQEYLSIHAVEEAAFLAVILGKKGSSTLVYDMQSSLPEQLTKHLVFRPRLIQYGLRLVERWLLRRVDSVACSVGLSRYVSSVCPAVPVREWHFPSINPEADFGEVQALRKELEIADSAKVVLYSGTFEEYQGIFMFLEAMTRIAEEVPECVFILVGARSDSEIEATKDRLDPALKDRVRVVLRQPREIIPLYLDLADLLVSPRIHGRNLPLKIFDYLAAGKPIVATALPTHEKILNESRAVLVDPSAARLALETARLLRDPKRMQELADEASAYAEERLSWMSYVKTVSEIHGQTDD